MDPEMRSKVYEAARRMDRAYLATVVGQRPWVRPVRPTWDGNDLFVATWADTRKLQDLRTNPWVQLFYEVDEGWQHLRVSGVAELVEDPAEKRRAWKSFSWDLAPYFGAPDDPNFALIRVRQKAKALGAPSLSAYLTRVVEEKLEESTFDEILDEIFREQQMTDEERAWAEGVLDR